MKSLPRPKDQQYVGLYDRVSERKEEPGNDHQQYREVDVSRFVPSDDFRKVFIDVKEDRGRYVRCAEKQKRGSHSAETVDRGFDP